MKHLGDITKLHGYSIPVVDIITGGSPCQDVSVAGLREGIKHEANGDEETTRSGLFFDQVRIVKEMRESDRRKGRHGVDVRPRYMVWENVPGAFSSNGGKDFQAVLTEIARIVEPDYPDVPLPDKGGWPKAGCIFGQMGNWSIAYRVHDAQYWGVPQRRKRIALLADFNGLTAPAILFDPQLWGEAEDSEPHEAVRDSGAVRRPEVQPLSESLSRDSEPNGEAGEGAAESSAGRADGTGANLNVLPFDTTQVTSPLNYSVPHYGDPCHPLASNQHAPAVCVKEDPAVGINGDVAGTLDGSYHKGCGERQGIEREVVVSSRQTAFRVPSFNYAAMLSDNPNAGFHESETANSLDGQGGNPGCYQGGTAILCYDARGNGNGQLAPTITGDHQNRVTDYTALCVGNGQLNQMSMAEQCNTLDTMHDQQAVLVSDDPRFSYCPETGKALHAKANLQFREDSETYVVAAVDCRNGTENNEVNGILQAQGQNLNSNNVVRTRSIVRRLTPLECSRLQGYPDGWLDIGDYTDENGKLRHEADTQKYRAAGNSIALPFWAWLFRRINAYYERPATMGSLFDGIGGFPLTALRSGIKPLWASEIEAFPIAVCKKHFGDEDAGIEGDIYKYL